MERYYLGGDKDVSGHKEDLSDAWRKHICHTVNISMDFEDKKLLYIESAHWPI